MKYIAFALLACISCVLAATDPERGQCDAVLIIDSLARRSGESTTAVRNRYESYFNDVIAFYDENFNIAIDLDYIYYYPGTVSSTANDLSMLQAFNQKVLNREFGSEMPDNACFYHLVTGRALNTLGTAHIGALCQLNAVSLNSDVGGNSNADLTVRQMIHEIGNLFNGNHNTYYTAPTYTCNTGNGSPDLILRTESTTETDKNIMSMGCGVGQVAQEEKRDKIINEDDAEVELVESALRPRAVSYNFLDPDAFITSCATRQIKNTLASFTCLWNNNPFNHGIRLYADQNYQGYLKTVAARFGEGGSVCYNFPSISYTGISSFQFFGDVVEVRVYDKEDCKGTDRYYAQSRTTIGPEWDNKIQSLRFFY